MDFLELLALEKVADHTIQATQVIIDLLILLELFCLLGREFGGLLLA
jgi:hypothetical protein